MSNRQTEVNEKDTALYERLYRDDELAGDSNSIINQKKMLEEYAAQHGFKNCVHYTDDGYSGGNFDRPSWKKLLADIEAGKVGTVLVKDMSRIGRDYLQTGFYTEVLFREKGVRFIAISNGVDSLDKSTSEFAPFLNIMNEWYLRDCSRKQIAAIQARGKSGKPTTNHAIYGYKKDPEDHFHWIIDEEAAAVVKRIFQLSIHGHGYDAIARILREDKVERPSVYLAKRGQGTRKNDADMSRPYDWRGSTVRDMLAKPEYMGHTVNFRNYKESYKDKRFIQRPPEEWLIFENTHEAIVDEGTWKLAQKAKQTKKRTDSTGIANPLTGLMYCADCGAKMYNHKGMHQAHTKRYEIDPITGLYPYDNYDCASYTSSAQHTDRKCRSHYISTRAVRALILDTIKLVSTYAISNEEEFIQKVREASEVKQKESAKELKRKISKARKRYAELDVLIKKLYESYATGKLAEKRFELLCADYEREQAELEGIISSDEEKLSTFEADSDRVEQFLTLAKKYTDFEQLTTPMIYEFIDKIIVHAPDKSSGERVQEVEIYLKFIGKFDVPMPEPTPEELEAMEKEQQRRAYNREKGRRQRERQKQRREAAKVTEAQTKNTPEEATT